MAANLNSNVLIIGGGQAGFQTAHTLRAKGHVGPIQIIGDEPHLPYQRPPLSKAFLAGELNVERLFFRPATYYEQQNIDIKLGVSVESLCRTSKTVRTTDGTTLAYDVLVLATGARVRPLPDGICTKPEQLLYLRGIDDVQRLLAASTTKNSFLIIGGGFIGLEAAATLKKLGKTVVVAEFQPMVIPGLVAPELSQYLENLHRNMGVDVRTNTNATHVRSQADNGFDIGFADGIRLNVDAVLVGIGVLPNVEFGQAAGLKTDRGFCVDAQARTNDPNIFAVGDCAHGQNTWVSTPIHLESVQNAIDQASIAAQAILGSDKEYAAVPWFWSDQYHVKIQMAGLITDYDQTVVTGEPDDDKFSIFYFQNDQLIAVHTANHPVNHMAARRILAQAEPVTFADCTKHGFDGKALMNITK